MFFIFGGKIPQHQPSKHMRVLQRVYNTSVIVKKFLRISQHYLKPFTHALHGISATFSCSYSQITVVDFIVFVTP